MAFVTPKELYSIVGDKTMAVGAFNVHNMEYVQGVIAAAEQEKAPVILMLGEPMLAHINLDMLANIAVFGAKAAEVPVAVMLDHGTKMSNINRCMELGISLMVDGSHLPYEQNVAFTKDIVATAHELGLSVEGELGSLSGAEDADETAAEHLTNPLKAKDFIEKTNVDALAISIGNCHGKYLKPPRLDFERLAKIKKVVGVPLVLHGGSDLPEEMSVHAINEGIKKFNIGTDLKYAMSMSLKETLNKEPMPFQPHHTLCVARDAVTNVAREKIRLFKNGLSY